MHFKMLFYCIILFFNETFVFVNLFVHLCRVLCIYYSWLIMLYCVWYQKKSFAKHHLPIILFRNSAQFCIYCIKGYYMKGLLWIISREMNRHAMLSPSTSFWSNKIRRHFEFVQCREAICWLYWSMKGSKQFAHLCNCTHSARKLCNYTS